ncbi:DsbA family protein [Bifidobacterium callitrichidarum]|uniref:Disulfide bond formation protein DsbA n=1 Tax=Bifidobacterium callitrichidarum TaxID=2052941 RepID=A0A2U2NCD7_9BIFI|nr:thioredoxin domain-containing protein [Bifidobacterium callitrichidarum]PWG66782.1 disulfide bond formation protein DsbA [Bifidobacterium callitrichidarum]
MTETRPIQTGKESKTSNTNPWIRTSAVLTTVIVIMAFAIGYLLASYKTCTATQDKTQQSAQSSSVDIKQMAKQMNESDVKPSKASEQGGFLISKNGYNKPVRNVPTIGVYEEPMCPYCGELNRSIDPMLTKMVKSGQINMDLHLVNFLNSASTDSYSDRVVNGAITIIELDKHPEHLLGFLSNIYEKDFQPGEGENYTPVSNGQLIEQAVKAGVNRQVAEKAFSSPLTYKNWVDAETAYTTNRPDLTSDNQTGFSTPTMTINGKVWTRTQTSSDYESLRKELLKAIGLAESNVGVETVKPSIGDSGQYN